MAAPVKLSIRKRFNILGEVAKTTFRAAPLAVVSQLIGAVIDAVLPIVTAYFAALTTTALAAAYAGNADAGGQALWYVMVTALLGVASTAWSSVQRYIGEMARYKIDASVNDRLYRQFVSLEYWRYDDKETADLFDKAQNFSFYFSFIFGDIASMFSSLVQVVVSVVALSLIEWWLGLLLLVAVVPSMYVQFKISKLQAEHWKGNVSTRRVMNGIKWSAFQAKNIAELRVYGVAKYMLGWFSRLREKDDKQRIIYERQYIGKRLIADGIQAAAELLILIFTVLEIIGRRQPIGQFIYVQQLVQRGLGGANSLISLFSSRDEDLATLFDFDAFMKLPTSDFGSQPLRAIPEVIELRDVSFTYPKSDAEVLHDISMTITRHDHIAIVGENGAGKSTLIKLLLGLYAPNRGEILFDGEHLRDIKKSDWHARVGLLQQEFIHYYFATIKKNVTLGDVSHPFDEARFERALDRAEAAGFVAKLPKGRDNLVDKWAEDDDGNSGTELSGGQWQRLALARNFYRDAPYVILDEPTSAIDALAESRIFNHLFASKEKTIITVSHRLSTIKKADRIYVMHEGRLVESGGYQELIDTRGHFYEMFESQL
jgi:ATP-binding cassette subfamily B protein/ATP-binding cassette subfamily C protein